MSLLRKFENTRHSGFLVTGKKREKTITDRSVFRIYAFLAIIQIHYDVGKLSISHEIDFIINLQLNRLNLGYMNVNDVFLVNWFSVGEKLNQVRAFIKRMCLCFGFIFFRHCTCHISYEYPVSSKKPSVKTEMKREIEYAG